MKLVKTKSERGGWGVDSWTGVSGWGRQEVDGADALSESNLG